MFDFMDMGKNAVYIWTSYGLTLIVLIANLIIPIWQERAILRLLARKARRKQRDDHHR